jgi:hypothetical protein
MLADPSDNKLVLADGTVIDTESRRPEKKRNEKLIEVPSNTEAQREITAVRRRVSDLPLPPKQMNMLSVVLSYTLFGLSDYEIAVATQLSEQQIGQIKMLDAYTSMYDTVIATIIKQDSEDIRTMFAQHAKSAFKKVVAISEESENELAALSASKDILDRAGFRPADVIEHRHKLDGGLTIEIIKRDKTIEVPTLDINGDMIDGRD